MREINLLPPTRRQTLHREIMLGSMERVLTTLITSLSILTGGGAIAIVILSTISYTAAATVGGEFEAVTSEYRVLRDEITVDNFFLQYVHDLDSERVVWSDFLPTFFASIPPDITLQSIGGSAPEKEEGETTEPLAIFTVAGQANARSRLTIFADRLRLLSGVNRVEAPNSNLIRREDPLFRFTLYFDPNPPQP